ncbi:substrate-binding domain-containing protein [Agromyces archimandritae]|uniref:Substrate-binding domain-containing protein n=2 Tax=Agromyces archimandritae TaxID=2781962 RepID=A0A975FR87_9MICO|nr:substrate-binding domain-containing protein [Agromyces archimandritae]
MLDGIAEGIAPLGAGLLLLPDTGNTAAGNTDTGNTAAGNTAAGNTAAGDTATGNTATGNTATGNTAAGNTAAGDTGTAKAGIAGLDAAVSVEDAPVDAVVLIGCSPRLGDTVAALARRGIPTVAVEGAAGAGIPEISLDNRDATRRGAEHLRGLGHERVATVTLPMDAARTRGPVTPETVAAATGDTARERLLGARDVYPEIGGRIAAASSIEEGILAGRELLADPAERPTAIIAQSDLLAAGVIMAAEELGLSVPGELSVLGFDGIRVDGLQHDLTTLVQPSVAKGRAAGECVVRMLGGEEPESVRFTSVLHIGDTTAPAR